MRFKSRTELPKGLIKFTWYAVRQTMIEHCIGELCHNRLIVACKQSDLPLFQRKLLKDIELIPIVSSTGQASTVHQAMSILDPKGGPVIVINCDNGFDIGGLRQLMDYCYYQNADMGVNTFTPKERFEEYGYVDGWPSFHAGIEKKAMSKYALAGAFYFKSPSVFLEAYERAAKLGRPVHYLSQLFADIVGVKRNFLHPAGVLHEWGTPEAIDADKTVTIDWNNLE